MVFFPESGVVRYLSAKEFRVALYNGEPEILSLANANVTPDIQLQKVQVVQQFLDVFPI
jgi:hypothetical protein